MRQVNFRCPEDLYALFESKAKESGLSFTTWWIALGLEASGHGELRKQLERVAARRPGPKKKSTRAKRR